MTHTRLKKEGQAPSWILSIVLQSLDANRIETRWSDQYTNECLEFEQTDELIILEKKQQITTSTRNAYENLQVAF